MENKINIFDLEKARAFSFFIEEYRFFTKSKKCLILVYEKYFLFTQKKACGNISLVSLHLVKYF